MKTIRVMIIGSTLEEVERIAKIVLNIPRTLQGTLQNFFQDFINWEIGPLSMLAGFDLEIIRQHVDVTFPDLVIIAAGVTSEKRNDALECIEWFKKQHPSKKPLIITVSALSSAEEDLRLWQAGTLCHVSLLGSSPKLIAQVIRNFIILSYERKILLEYFQFVVDNQNEISSLLS